MVQQAPTAATAEICDEPQLFSPEFFNCIKVKLAAAGTVISDQKLSNIFTLLMLHQAAQQLVAGLPESTGYARLLMENGFNSTSARGLAGIAVRHGRRVAAEAKRIRPTFQAIRFLALAQRQRRSMRRRADVLLAASSETTIIETLFHSAGLKENEFLFLLRGLVEERGVDLARIRSIAKQLLPHLVMNRGPKISAASAASEFILRNSPELAALRSSQGLRARGRLHVDALTQATRREFGNENFDPRPAARRLKRRDR